MLTDTTLRDILARIELSRLDKVLAIMYFAGGSVATTSDIKAKAKALGVRRADTWNVSSILSRGKGVAVRTALGWELTGQGILHLRSLGLLETDSSLKKTKAELRAHLPKISDPQVRSFVEEAIECFERKLYRAAVVLSWVGAIAVLQDYVYKNHLLQFNDQLLRVQPKAKKILGKDDFCRIKEYDFLQILSAISVFGKNVKQQLEERLNLRNACGHPNSLVIGEYACANHIEILMRNVFEKF